MWTTTYSSCALLFEGTDLVRCVLPHQTMGDLTPLRDLRRAGYTCRTASFCHKFAPFPSGGSRWFIRLFRSAAD